MNKLFFSLIAVSLGLPAVSAAAASHISPDPVAILKGVALFVLILSLFLVTPTGQRVGGKYKRLFFLLYVIPVVAASLYLAGATVYENTTSVTKGPVHWHADYQVWACGQQLDLIDPKGLKNKIGTPVLHEHDDNRIHVEGTVMEYQDVSLGAYFTVIGGELDWDRFTYPTNNGVISVKDGDFCPNGDVGTLSVYVNGQRIDDPAGYVMSPEIFVPSGDCIIIDFDAGESPTTDKICESWRANEMTYERFQEEQAAQGGDN